MTVRELVAVLNKRENLHYLDKEIFIVDHEGKEIGLINTAMSTSHWKHFIIYTKEGSNE